MEGNTVVISGKPSNQFLPVIDATFAGDLQVQPAAIQPDSNDNITLLPATADKLFNADGEGYYDSPTLRGEKWQIAIKRAGFYKVEIAYKRGPFSRVIDIAIGGQILKANLYGAERDSSVAGIVQLTPSNSLSVSISPGSPAVRGAKLDLEITRVSITFAETSH